MVDAARCSAMVLMVMAGVGQALGSGHMTANPAWQFGAVLLCGSAGCAAGVSWRRWGEVTGAYRSYLGRRLTRLAPSYLVSLSIFLLLASGTALKNGVSFLPDYGELLNPIVPSRTVAEANPTWWVIQVLVACALLTPIAASTSTLSGIAMGIVVCVAISAAPDVMWSWHFAMTGSFVLCLATSSNATKLPATARVAISIGIILAVLLLGISSWAQPSALAATAGSVGIMAIASRRKTEIPRTSETLSQAAYPFLLVYPIAMGFGTQLTEDADAARILALLGIVVSMPLSIALGMAIEKRMHAIGEKDSDLIEDMFGNERELRDNPAGKEIFGND